MTKVWFRLLRKMKCIDNNMKDRTEYSRQYYKDNKEELYLKRKAKIEAESIEHKQKRAEYQKQWRERNRGRYTAYKKEWARKWRLKKGMKVYTAYYKYHKDDRYTFKTRNGAGNKTVHYRYPKKSGIENDIYEEERHLPKSYKDYLKKANIKVRWKYYDKE